MLESMLRIRAYEDTLAPHRLDACTSVGQEASAVGVMAALQIHDRVLTHHRSTAHLLARGASPTRLMAEILGHSGGDPSEWSGFGKELGVVLTSGIGGGELSVVTGVALAQKLGYGLPEGIVAVFFDESAAAEGVFHESLNLASMWDLPVLYVCENNQWGSDQRGRETLRTEYISSWVQKFDMPAIVVDGSDVQAVNTAAAGAIAQIRRTSRPSFMELQTYRPSPHESSDDPRDLDPRQLDQWKQRDPVAMISNRMLATGELTAAEFTKLQERASAEMQAALSLAQSSLWSSPAEATSA
jgi:pyruvate dehydrogenase E1 component alpha subunit